MMNNFITKELLHKEVHNWSNYLGALLATEMILNNNIKIIGFYTQIIKRHFLHINMALFGEK